MRYEHGFVVQIPHIADGTRQIALVSSNSNVDHRRVKRVLRQWVKHWLGRHLHSIELAALMKSVKKHKEPMQYFVQQKSAPVDAPTDR